jgi:ubiquinone/menaquinone biosynthesis C-methylase UbiE
MARLKVTGKLFVTVASAEFWDRIADRYSRQPIADGASYARKLAATQARMRPDMKVLELGCGTGSTALEHAPHVAQIDATDVSAAMIEIGRDKAAKTGIGNVKFVQAGVEDFDAPDGSYDMILALSLLHLLPERESALATIYRWLKPDGIFVSSTVCLADRMGFMRPIIPVMQWLGKAPYVSFLRAAGFQAEVEAAGFSVEEQWTHGRANSLFLIARRNGASLAQVRNGERG